MHKIHCCMKNVGEKLKKNYRKFKVLLHVLLHGNDSLIHISYFCIFLPRNIQEFFLFYSIIEKGCVYFRPLQFSYMFLLHTSVVCPCLWHNLQESFHSWKTLISFQLNSYPFFSVPFRSMIIRFCTFQEGLFFRENHHFMYPFKRCRIIRSLQLKNFAFIPGIEGSLIHQKYSLFLHFMHFHPSF